MRQLDKLYLNKNWTFKIREGVDENKILLVFQADNQHNDI